MEDKTLEDFFAKKDKSKKKKSGGQKKKFTTTDSIAKNIQDQQAAKREQEQAEPIHSASPFIKADEEWVDYKTKEKADFSTISIDDLNISNSQERQSKVEEDVVEDEGIVEEDVKDDDQLAPWQGSSCKQLDDKSEIEQETAVKDLAIASPPTQKLQEQDTTAKKYVPPAIRRSAGTTLDSLSSQYEKNSYVPPSRRGIKAGTKGSAPSLHDNMEFPSLADSLSKETKDVRTMAQPASFEYVKRGARHAGLADVQPVQIDNKYQSLID